MHYFAVILSYKVPLEIIEAHRPNHRAFLDQLVANGTLLLSGPQASHTGGLLIVRGKSREELETLLAQDPFAVHQLADYHFIEFKPTKWVSGLREWMPTT